jgi:hypothetical protein
MKGKPTTVLALIGLVIAAVALAVAVERPGEASSDVLYSFSTPQGLAQQTAVAKRWSAGAIPLCLHDGGQATLTSITPVVQKGEIRLDRIAVRRVKVSGRVPEMPGVPPDLRPVAGFIVRSPAPCSWPQATSTFYEVVVVADRNGPGGGYIKGLRVDYKVGSTRGSYTIPFTFALCGHEGGPKVCRA